MVVLSDAPQVTERDDRHCTSTESRCFAMELIDETTTRRDHFLPMSCKCQSTIKSLHFLPTQLTIKQTHLASYCVFWRLHILGLHHVVGRLLLFQLCLSFQAFNMASCRRSLSSQVNCRRFHCKTCHLSSPNVIRLSLPQRKVPSGYHFLSCTSSNSSSSAAPRYSASLKHTLNVWTVLIASST